MTSVSAIPPTPVGKMSFAKAASVSATPDHSQPIAVARVISTIPALPKDPREHKQVNASAVKTIVNPTSVSQPEKTVAGCGTNLSRDGTGQGAPASKVDGKVVEGLNNIKLEPKRPNVVVNGSSSACTGKSIKAQRIQTPSDEVTQRVDSNSDLGTKPFSLDGKSSGSGTTFALDEESLRPDDSASMKAATEDDDAISIRGSYFINSRMGSEVAARMRCLQIGDMPIRGTNPINMSGSQTQGILTPLSGISEKPPEVRTKPGLMGTADDNPSLINLNGCTQHPDERLLEAMQSQKDRLFVLRLEQQVIDFVQTSTEPFMDVPPSHAFHRLLSHKLADYYHMTHSYEQMDGTQQGNVRIFKTPFCRVPLPLSTFLSQTSSTSSPAPAVVPRKIMRRGEEGDSGLLSGAPSKSSSDVGGGSKEKGILGKEKLTREEREELYKQARDRIFSPEGEECSGMSRASSTSEKDKPNNGGKKKTGKQRCDDSGSFETRSQFMITMNGSQQTWTSANQQFYPVGNTGFSSQYMASYQGPLQAMYGPNQSFPQMPLSNGFMPPYNGLTNYPTQPMPQPAPPPQRYQAPNPATASTQFAGPPAPNASQPGWQAPTYNQGHAPYSPIRSSPVPAAGIPYAYGQLPVNANPNDPKSAHPIPGSFNRQIFNPKTQSFVPGNGMGYMAPPPSGQFGPSPPLHGCPQFSPPHVSYTGYQQPQSMPQPVGYGPTLGSYGMARQGSNNSLPAYHQPVPQPSHAPPFSQALNYAPAKPVAHMSKTGVHHGHAQSSHFNHLPSYGNPASLPQKPSS